MFLSFSSLKPFWSRLRLSRSFESKPQARAGSRTAKPLTLNTIAAAAVSEDSLPFAEPKSPRGAPKGATHAPFNLSKVGRPIEGDPKSGKSENKKDKGKNGGSNNASSGSARTGSLLPPDTSYGKGIRSRTHSASNTPTSSPPTSPETKKENLSSGNKSRAPSVSNTPTSSPSNSPETKKENLASSNKSRDPSASNTPTKPQPSSLQGSSPLQARKPTPQPAEEPSITTALQGKQENFKPAALPTIDLPPTPPASPETQSLTVLVTLDSSPAPSLLGNPSGLAVTDKQDVKPVARPSPAPPTPPASPPTRNLAVQADPGKGTAASLLEPQAA